MRETQFIAQNKEKWERFEAMMQDGDHDPAELNNLFIQITDDLSYARTFYPNRSVRHYLNGLAQGIFHKVYSKNGFPSKRIWDFWAQELPRLMWETRRSMQLSLALFFLAFGIGVLSSYINPDFARTILGNGYVEMTLENIAKGDPMAVYKDRDAMGMSLGITANNLRVALLTVVSGILTSVATVFIMLYNGIMVGAFQYFFVIHGVFWESFTTIWIHGTLEISAIIIAGGAGLVLGSGLLFPGTYTQMQALRISARRGLKVFLGVVPIIILAGLFEGFLTRSTEIPMVLRGAFIFANLSFVLWYFVALPWSRARSGAYSTTTTQEKEPPPSRPHYFNLHAVKSPGVLLWHIIVTQNTMTNIKEAFRISVFLFFGVLLLKNMGFGSPNWLEEEINGIGLSSLNRAHTMFIGMRIYSPLILLWAVFFAAFNVKKLESYRRYLPESDAGEITPRSSWTWVSLLLPSTVFALICSTCNFPFFFVFLFATVGPLVGVWMIRSYFYTSNPLVGLVEAFRLIHWPSAIWMSLGLVFVLFLLFIGIESPITSMIAELIGWGFDGVPTEVVASALQLYFSTFVFLFTFRLLVFGSFFLHFSSREIQTAYSLFQRIQIIGFRNKIRGLPRE